MLVRDTEGRVLLCNLTYKQDWDLPGGVVEVNEAPAPRGRPRGRGGARARHRRRPAGADRLAAAVERLGRRGLPGVRRRRARPVARRADRPAGAGDPERPVLHARPRCTTSAPTSPRGGSTRRWPTSRPAGARSPSQVARSVARSPAEGRGGLARRRGGSAESAASSCTRWSSVAGGRALLQVAVRAGLHRRRRHRDLVEPGHDEHPGAGLARFMCGSASRPSMTGIGHVEDHHVGLVAP